jgi:hypothetical protein
MGRHWMDYLTRDKENWRATLKTAKNLRTLLNAVNYLNNQVSLKTASDLWNWVVRFVLLIFICSLIGQFIKFPNVKRTARNTR